MSPYEMWFSHKDLLDIAELERSRSLEGSEMIDDMDEEHDLAAALDEVQEYIERANRHLLWLVTRFDLTDPEGFAGSPGSYLDWSRRDKAALAFRSYMGGTGEGVYVADGSLDYLFSSRAACRRFCNSTSEEGHFQRMEEALGEVL